MLGEDVGVGVHPEALLKWAESPNQMRPLWLRWLAPLLAALAVAGAVGVGGLGNRDACWCDCRDRGGPYLPPEKAAGGSAARNRARISRSGSAFRRARRAWRRTRSRRRDCRRCSASFCRAACQVRRRSRGCRTLVDLINSRHNIFVRIIDAPLMYSVQVAFAAERWRTAHGSALRLWVNAVGEMEALLSLATYSFEHPADPFPEFADGAASFDGEGLGHPLVPSAALRSQRCQHHAGRRGFCWSAVPTCRGRARCCARSG